jgi:Calcineurin-like phosphoesterase
MRIQLLSDLHLETHPHFKPEPAPGADVLVLAGDIGSYQYGSLLQGADFGLERFSPRHGWPTPVLYLPGNHEYDALDIDEAHARLRETCARLGITWLERELVTMARPAGDPRPSLVRFVGTTLWSDFEALVPRSGPLAAQLRARDKAFRAANFYLRTTGSTRRGLPWLADGVRELSLLSQDWLRKALADPFEGTTVAVTHFAPSLKSADPRYGMTPGTAGFCNALDDLLPFAHVWLHGHLHAPSDYTVAGERGGAATRCRVVANPLGYARKGEQVHFRPRGCIEV